MKTTYKIAFLLIIVLAFSSCAPQGPTPHEYGFFRGIIHGFCFPFALIGKLFSFDVGIYAEHNSGFFYWLGFIIGLSCLGGGGAKSSRS